MWLVLLICRALHGRSSGILIGLPTLRLRGDYLAIVTLGFGEIVPQFVRNADSSAGFDLTHGSFGITPDRLPRLRRRLSERRREVSPVTFSRVVRPGDLYYWARSACSSSRSSAAVRLRDSRLGRAWIAIREDETAAAAMGIPLMRTKTWAYAIGAFFGGIAGAYYASFKSRRVPERLLLQHLDLPALHGDPRRHGLDLGRRRRRHRPRLAEHRGPRRDRRQAERRGGGRPSSTRGSRCRSTSSGSTGSSSC